MNVILISIKFRFRFVVDITLVECVSFQLVIIQKKLSDFKCTNVIILLIGIKSRFIVNVSSICTWISLSHFLQQEILQVNLLRSSKTYLL